MYIYIPDLLQSEPKSADKNTFRGFLYDFMLYHVLKLI